MPGFLLLGNCLNSVGSGPNIPTMLEPTIFTISASWDSETAVWTGHCDDIPAAADSPTLDGLLDKITALVYDLLPGNHSDTNPENLFLQITALREVEPVAA